MRGIAQTLLGALGWWRVCAAAEAPPDRQLGEQSGATLHRGEAEPDSTQPHLGGGMPEGVGQQPVSQSSQREQRGCCKETRHLQMSCLGNDKRTLTFSGMSANSCWCLVILVDSVSSEFCFSKLQVVQDRLISESRDREKSTTETVSPFSSRGTVILRLSYTDPAVLQHDGCQLLLHVLYLPLSLLMFGVELRQQHGCVKIQYRRFRSAVSAVHLGLLRCWSGVKGWKEG